MKRLKTLSSSSMKAKQKAEILYREERDKALVMLRFATRAYARFKNEGFKEHMKDISNSLMNIERLRKGGAFLREAERELAWPARLKEIEAWMDKMGIKPAVNKGFNVKARVDEMTESYSH